MQSRDTSQLNYGFHEPVSAWFNASFPSPTRAQSEGWAAIRTGAHTLILAPTGSGKTLAAFLVAINRLMFDPVPGKQDRCRILYVSPLKALAVDVEKNLRAPLVGVGRYSERLGIDFHEPAVAVRTGDTPARERAQFQRNPADILITTPESLYLLLTSQARETLRSVQTVIIDEIHAMVGSKRGAHLSLSLERLAEIAGQYQRIGLSATQRPLEEVARFLGGFSSSSDLSDRSDLSDSQSTDHSPLTTHHSLPRPVTIVDAGSSKELELLVEVPVEDMARLGEPVEIPSGNAAQGEVRSSIWPAMHPLILDLIKRHRSTLIFVNSRRLAERMASALNDLAGEEIVRAHHGSIAREQRMLIEDELKSGRLPAMVATSTLELGIDMGAIDLVIQVECPPSVASGMQRIGRAGHNIGVPSKGIILPKYRGDLLSCAALTERMKAGAVERMRYPRNPLDVLSQQITAMVSVDDWNLVELENVIRRAAPFADLPRSMLEETLDMLSGRYPSDDFAELRPRITWDRLNGTLHAREGAKRVAITEAGTIPNRGLFGVFLLGAEKGQGRVGELDEEMVLETRVGEVFLLGASSWRVEEITHDRVIVSPAPGVPGKMPFWHGDSADRPLEFGKAIGALTRSLRDLPEPAAVNLLMSRHALNESAARNLLKYLEDQASSGSALPDDRTIVVESYMDELGDWRVCILSPFGGKVHAPWAMSIAVMMREQTDHDIDILWTDDGIVVRFPEQDEPPPLDWLIPDPEEVEDLVIRQLGAGGSARPSGQSAVPNALFASRFREAAARALLLPRKHPGQRAPLWQQRKRAADLLKATSKYGSFPIILETFRECLKDVFDMPAFNELLRDIRSRDVKIVQATTRVPSPFAASLMYNYIANFMYEGDAPIAERRAQALIVDPSQLRELLGEVELRQLLDEDSLHELELYLQHLTVDRAVKHADGLHDLFIRLGDLSPTEVKERATSTDSALEWLEKLEKNRRIVLLSIAGEPRFIAAEDVGRYRDALGIPPPPGLPGAFLEYTRDPLGDLVMRYARTHGPFHIEDLAGRYGLGVGPILVELKRLESSGRLVEGEFRPGGAGREWCDSGVLRAIRQKSLARLRHEVEPVEQPALGRLYLAWHGIRIARHGEGASIQNPKANIQNQLSRRSSAERLIEVIEQLQGAPIPISELESRILPARIPGYDPRDLDALAAGGVIIWVGCESLGQHDGRIALYLTEHAPLLLAPASPGERGLAEGDGKGDIKHDIREHLADRGASFFPQILQASGGFGPDVLEALWDLVWAGEVTNDTFQPLRSYTNPRRQAGRSKIRAHAESSFRRRSVMFDRRARRVSATALSAAPRAIAPEAAGRWSLVRQLAFPTITESLTARAAQLLERYGVLTREAVQAESIPGGFSAVYGVLKALEEAGRVRRGYFVSGLGATQFALPGALDRLRALREMPDRIESVLISAADPANPYGAALPWPERSDGRRPMRQAGAVVILVDGCLAGWIGRGERHLLTFADSVSERDPDDVRFEIARVLTDEVTSFKRRAVFVTEVDGEPAKNTPMTAALIEAGFMHTTHGFLRRI